MRPFFVILLLSMATPAVAQSVAPDPDGTVFTVIRPGTPYFTPPGRAIPQNGITISGYMPRCPDGWSLVATPRPMCAHELKEPE